MVSLGHSHNILQGLALLQVVNYENIASLFRICGNVMIVTSASKFLFVGTKFLNVGSHISTLILISLTLLHCFHSTAKGKSLSQTINKRGTKIIQALELRLPTHTYLTSTDYEFMLKFIGRTIRVFYLADGKRLKLKINRLVSFTNQSMKKQLSLNQGPIRPISQASTSFLMNPLSTT